MVGSFGTDRAEQSGSQTLQHKDQLDGSRSIESQARFIGNYGAAVDDLTFKESTVRQVTDRGRAKVVSELMQELATQGKKARVAHRADQAAILAQSAAAGEPPSEAIQEVRAQLATLQGIRARGKPADIVSARPPLDALSLLSIDAITLKKTKVAAELNQDYWKVRSAPEVKRLAAALVQKWRSAYRREEDGPSERTLRNTASALEESAHSAALRDAGRFGGAQQYNQLIEALLKKLTPELADGLLEGREVALDLVGRVQKRQVAELKNKGNTPPAPGTLQALLAPPAKRPREERVLSLENQPSAGSAQEGRQQGAQKPHEQAPSSAPSSASSAGLAALAAQQAQQAALTEAEVASKIEANRQAALARRAARQAAAAEPVAEAARPDQPQGAPPDPWQQFQPASAKAAHAAAVRALRAPASSAAEPPLPPPAAAPARATAFATRLASTSHTIILPI